MSRRPLAVLLTLVGLVAPAMAADERAPLGRPRLAPPERPTLAIGQKWFLSDGTYELKRIEGRDYVFVGPDRELHLTPELAVAGARRGTDYVSFRPPPRLRWPLRPGTWGTGDSNWRVSRLPKPGASTTRSCRSAAVG